MSSIWVGMELNRFKVQLFGVSGSATLQKEPFYARLASRLRLILQNVLSKPCSLQWMFADLASGAAAPAFG